MSKVGAIFEEEVKECPSERSEVGFSRDYDPSTLKLYWKNCGTSAMEETSSIPRV